MAARIKEAIDLQLSLFVLLLVLRFLPFPAVVLLLAALVLFKGPSGSVTMSSGVSGFKVHNGHNTTFGHTKISTLEISPGLSACEHEHTKISTLEISMGCHNYSLLSRIIHAHLRVEL